MPFIDDYVHVHYYSNFTNKIQGKHSHTSEVEVNEKHKVVDH